jgi:hypothetical protein
VARVGDRGGAYWVLVGMPDETWAPVEFCNEHSVYTKFGEVLDYVRT